MEITEKEIKQWSKKFKGWFYYPDYVISADLEEDLGFNVVDCPLVFQLKDDDNWYMWYTGYDGRGYQTALATSSDLVTWIPQGIVMSFGKKGSYDYGGVTFGGSLFKSYDLKAPRVLKKYKGKYWVLYGCYPKQGGYELRPGAEGVAWSSDGFNWNRISEKEAILSVVGAKEWEKDCIYQPWLVEYNDRFYNFYNAANGQIEQMGLALSADILNWQRYSHNPIIKNGPKGSYDEKFCSDAKVFRDGDHWVMFYFGVGKKGAHIMVAFSRDLINWYKNPEPIYKAGGHPAGLDEKYAHKISLIYNPANDTYYLYYCAVGKKGRGIALLTNKKIND